MAFVQKEYMKVYRKKNKVAIKAYNDAYAKQHRELYARSSRAWAQRNSELRAVKRAKEHAELKNAVIEYYSKGTYQCVNCGIGDMDVLCIDHIEACGVGGRGRSSGNRFYRWLVSNGFPRGFQVLCANCNMKKEKERRRREGKTTNTTLMKIPKLF